MESLYEAFRRPKRIDDVLNCLSIDYSKDLLNHVILDLRDQGLLIQSNSIDLQTYVKIFEAGIRQYPIKHMYFIPTSDCNFRCTYCFVEDVDRQFIPNRMTLDTAIKGLEVFAKLTEKAGDISITIYGGEPLLNADLVYSAMRCVRSLEEKSMFKKPVKMTLVTNGSLVDRKTVEAILETKCDVSISIDGPKNLHDTARKDMAGNCTFDNTISGYHMLQEAGADPGVSCTLHGFNVEHIEEITEFIVKELKPKGVGFNVLLPRINAGKHANYSYEFAASQLIRAFRVLREHGIYEDRMMRRVRPYVQNGFHLKDCMGVGGQIVLTPEGRIGPCQAFLGFDDFFPLSIDELHSRLPSISSEDIYKDPLFDEWRHRFPLNMKKCAECFAIAICGGGCPYASYVNHGSIWEIDERVCFQAKQIMEWMIWDTYDHLATASEQKTALTFS